MISRQLHRDKMNWKKLCWTSQWKDGLDAQDGHYQVDEFDLYVPITNDDSLNDFEQKLATSQ